MQLLNSLKKSYGGKVRNKILLLSLMFIILNINLFSEEKMVIRFLDPSAEIIREFYTRDYDVASYKPSEYLDIVVSSDKYEELLNRGLDFIITQTGSNLKENLSNTRDLEGYRNYSVLLSELEFLEALYPDICKLYDIGDSRGKLYFEEGNSNYEDYNHEIWAVKVSDNVETEEDEPCVYYLGAHHAREPISLEVVMAILNHILENYETDPTITDNVNNAQIWFVPLVNPDGHKIVTDEVDMWWRKNICDNNGNGVLDPSYYNNYPDGVDPNRNYGFEWGLVGASDNPVSQTYHGLEPFSEPETTAIKQLLDSLHFVTGISYHSYGEVVLFPFGYNNGVTSPDHDALEDLAVSMASSIPGIYSGFYTPQESWMLYPCMGTTDDYSYGVNGTFAYTFELADEFIPPAYLVDEICQDNIEAALILLDRVNQSTLTGHITDALSGLPMIAEIFIEGIDDTGVFRYPYQSNEEFGTYYRLLLDGTYNVTFSQYGYESVTIENVEINSEGQTTLDIELNPAGISNLSGVIRDAETLEFIENAQLEILNTPIETVTSNEQGEYFFPEIPVGVYEILITALNYTATVEEISLSEGDNVLDFELVICEAESFEYGVFDEIWSFGGNADWTIDTESYHGYYSARSGIIGSNQTSSLIIELDVLSDDVISFFKKVSCEDDDEDDFDYLAFYIDGVEQSRWDGETDWTEEIFNVSSGIHTFEWKYLKDGSVSQGSDCAWIDYIFFPETSGTDTDDNQVAMNSYILSNYPNPFNPSTVIEFYLKTEGKIILNIYNLKGQFVKNLKNDFIEPGYHTILWDGTDNSGKDVCSGLYFGKLRTSNYTSTKKMILMK